jgi:RNA polymerase sigma factor (sigma-70 family)
MFAKNVGFYGKDASRWRHNGEWPSANFNSNRMISSEQLIQFVNKHAAALELYAAQWTACPEDVVQVAFIKLAEQTVELENVTGWLYRVVRNGAISAARSSNRRRGYEKAAAISARGWFQRNDENELDAQTAAETLNRLSVDEREIIVARIWGGLTFEQIAELVEISPSTAHRRYEQALKVLRKELGGQWLTNNAPVKT